MRLIRGAAPGASLGENWAYMRDKGRPTTAGEVAAFADAKAPMPPSRAHLKRLARCHEPASEKRQALAAVPTCDFFKSQLGKLSQLQPPRETANAEGVVHARTNWQHERDKRRFGG